MSVGYETFFVSVGYDTEFPVNGADGFFVSTAHDTEFPAGNSETIFIEQSEDELVREVDSGTVTCAPLWFITNGGEVFWRGGLMYNGVEFRRYAMWDGGMWRVVCPSEPMGAAAAFTWAFNETSGSVASDTGSISMNFDLDLYEGNVG